MRKRLTALTCLLSLAWIAVGCATICYVSWLYKSHARDLAEKLSTIQAADAMQDVLWRLQATAMEVVERADTHTRFEVAELESAFERHVAEAEATSFTHEERRAVNKIREQFSLYTARIYHRLNPESLETPTRPFPVEMARLAHAVAESCRDLLEANERLLAEATAQRSRLRRSFEFILVVVFIVGPCVGMFWGFRVARGMSRSIFRISVSLKDATGELEHDVGRVDLSPSGDLSGLNQQVEVVSTQIKQVVKQLHQARRETMLADRLAAAGELAAGVAHELRNPLTSVKLLIQGAERTAAGRSLSNTQLHVIHEEIVRMENTIQGLLDFARPPRLHQVRHDLRDTLRRALNLIDGRLKQQDVVVAEQLPNVPVLVDGDPEQLHQVLVNLLLNGIESMPRGGKLQVKVQADDRPPGSCQVVVCDEGTGISQPIMERLFEPFVTTKERGTGLGLAISRRMVEQHGGKLTAANGEVRGAVFTVELPLCTSGPVHVSEERGGASSNNQSVHNPNP